MGTDLKNVRAEWQGITSKKNLTQESCSRHARQKGVKIIGSNQTKRKEEILLTVQREGKRGRDQKGGAQWSKNKTQKIHEHMAVRCMEMGLIHGEGKKCTGA